MSKNKRDPNCTCRKGVMGSYVNCPVHRLVDKNKRNLEAWGLVTPEEIKSAAEQLKAHKTRTPVVNNIPQLIETPAIETGTTTGNPLPQAWTFEVLAYCNSLGISPDELIEQHKSFKVIIDVLGQE